VATAAGLSERAFRPLDDQLVEHLAGRHTEALATSRSWRRHLATELGLDPSPALQAIEQDILRHGRDAG